MGVEGIAVRPVDAELQSFRGGHLRHARFCLGGLLTRKAILAAQQVQDWYDLARGEAWIEFERAVHHLDLAAVLE